MRKFILSAVLTAFPMSTTAEELDPRYTEVGRMIGTLDDTPFEFVGTFDSEREKSSVTIDARSGFPMILAQTRSVASDGSLTNPGVGVLIGPIMAGAPSKAEVTMMSEEGFYVASPDFDGSLPLQDLVFDETSLSFSVVGTLIPVKRENSEFKRDPSREPISISGAFNGTPTYRK